MTGHWVSFVRLPRSELGGAAIATPKEDLKALLDAQPDDSSSEELVRGARPGIGISYHGGEGACRL